MKKTAGLDIHKVTIFCGIFDGKHHQDVKEFSTTTVSIHSLGEYLHEQGVTQVALESTGIYWIAVWNILEAMGFELTLVNPYLIKQMPGRKSDVKDAQWIATLLHKELLRGSLIPEQNIRELRCYSRKYMRLQQKQTSTLQELERILEMAGIRITSLVSNISAKSVRQIIKQIIQGNDDAQELIKYIHGRILKRHGIEKVKEALQGFVLEQHRFLLEQAMEELELLEKQSEQCLVKMREICQRHYSKEMKLLKSIPGISEISALIIIAETGAEMKAFENSGKFTGWIGLRPRNDESAGKLKSTATTKGNKYLRTIVVQVAWAASRTKDSFFKEKFDRLCMRKPRKKALIAIGRKISVLIYNVLSREEPYNPDFLKVYKKATFQKLLEYHKKQIEKLEKSLSETQEKRSVIFVVAQTPFTN
jgi:transposase